MPISQFNDNCTVLVVKANPSHHFKSPSGNTSNDIIQKQLETTCVGVKNIFSGT